jgi:cell pole-organizing protein PopZ
MEELLASIRKAIHDDIGEVPASMSAQSSGTLYKNAMRELHVKAGDEAASAAAEIQQLREKINRSRAGDQLLREAASRPSSLATPRSAEAPPRRAWREVEPQAQLRPSIVEPEYPAPRARQERPAKVEVAAEPNTYETPAWREEEQVALPPPADYRARPEAAMLSGDTTQAVQAAFNRLAGTVLTRAAGERSIEDLTREMLRGMLKQWLDEHLPSLVERLVREEIERVARRGR